MDPTCPAPAVVSSPVFVTGRHGAKGPIFAPATTFGSSAPRTGGYIRGMNNRPAIQAARSRLAAHPVYASVQEMGDLHVFMRHHVFAVWDFMSLLKSLQSTLAPSRTPWRPTGQPELTRFINEIVVDEESDIAPPGVGRDFMSHYELYRFAMREVGADDRSIEGLIRRLGDDDLESALKHPEIPYAVQRFIGHTFSALATGKPHVIGAYFTFGREQVVPDMFSAVVERSGLTAEQAPCFHYYLQRHIELDGGSHGTLALRLMDHLIDGDPTRAREAQEAALEAIDARLQFWDAVHAEIQQRKARAAK